MHVELLAFPTDVPVEAEKSDVTKAASERADDRNMRRVLLAAVMWVMSGCGMMAVEHRGDALFRTAVASQLGANEMRAEALYHDILDLGLDWGPVWNNLAVIAVHRHDYAGARQLLANAVAANDSDVVALTNYGVICYHLHDLAAAHETLTAAREMRRRILGGIPSEGLGFNLDEDKYARATNAVDQIAKKYLARIDSRNAMLGTGAAEDLLADLMLRNPGGAIASTRAVF